LEDLNEKIKSIENELVLPTASVIEKSPERASVIEEDK
jgi:hypothetical protein